VGFFIAGAAVTIPAWIESEITGADIVRPFKLDIKDKGTLAPSEADSNRWPIENILDEKTDGSGWYSSYRFDSVDFSEYDESDVKKGLFPQEIAIRLREGRSWKIKGVNINPYTSKKFFDDNSKDAKRSLDRQLKFAKRELEDEPEEEKKTLLEQLDSKYNRIVKRLESTEENAQKCWARELEVFVSDTRVGPWKSVGTLNLSPSKSTQELIFKDGPVDAEFVMIKILSHGGGDFVSLGELEVIAANADPPADAHAHAKEVWPNVAAIGHKPSILWQVFAYILLTASEIMISITCLEFAYTQAPRKIKSIIMSIYLLSVSLGNLIVSFVNYVIQNDDLSSKLDGPSYYWFFTGMVFITAFIFIPIAKFYKGQTYIQEDESGEDAEKTHT